MRVSAYISGSLLLLLLLLVLLLCPTWRAHLSHEIAFDSVSARCLFRFTLDYSHVKFDLFYFYQIFVLFLFSFVFSSAFFYRNPTLVLLSLFSLLNCILICDIFSRVSRVSQQAGKRRQQQQTTELGRCVFTAYWYRHLIHGFIQKCSAYGFNSMAFELLQLLSIETDHSHDPFRLAVMLSYAVSVYMHFSFHIVMPSPHK